MLKFPPGLVYLLIKRGRLTSLDFVNSLPRSLESLHLGENSLGSLIRTDEGADVARPYKIKFPEGIHTLNLDQNRSLFTLYSSRNFAYPPGLTDLNLMQTNLSTAMGLENLPLLRVLNLGYNDMGSVDDLVIPPTLIRLTSFSLTNSGVRSLSGARFPAGLKHLKLSGNKIASLENIELPQYLETLSLQENQITSLADFDLPDSLLSLEFGSNKLTSVDGIQLPPKLNVLNLKENAINTINELQLPDSLRELYLDKQEENPLRIRASIRTRFSEPPYASVKRGLTSVAGIPKLPSQLHSLILCKNGLCEQAIEHWTFPSGLKRLYMHDNVFVNYPMWRREVRLALPNVEFDGGRESSDDDFLMMDYSDDEMY
ncbi:hypothetical protein BABINDRAFT_40179 [Babjeviella inositovora NRRL Y-12698]|uniref:Uncharacterized protein n=1 Tax=Babjeviella inositovora NRRL Y-12698 TaxID=984486 RepID=A0A1E3QK96_9ASCO|nr:uncharacterized protein BABINDRAFT_40179 [Babjeviella inositovora NRRL Y-12698]ODQ78105.1 hypothetical protein BABINDRAFT_40179 [Babjeviella inositovora NRRL Y-12698]